MTSLATIQRISDILPHPNADALELAKVLGWTIVVKKGEFRPGDLCVYVALDSILPERPEFEFLRSKQFRIRTIKLRGTISQGICFPVDILGIDIPSDPSLCFEGADVTELLNVVKYEKPLPKCQDAKGNFPTHLVSKTDEERVQNLPELIDAVRGKEIYVSIKHDGTSATYAKKGGELIVCSRNLELKDGNNAYWSIARQYNLIDKIPEGFVVQGEIVGPGIQNNIEQLKEIEFNIFNVYDNGRLYDYRELIVFCMNRRLAPVDLFYIGPNKWETLEEWLDLADTARYNNGAQAEGLVVRLAEGSQIHDKLGKPLSFKVISNIYALKHGE